MGLIWLLWPVQRESPDLPLGIYYTVLPMCVYGRAGVGTVFSLERSENAIVCMYTASIESNFTTKQIQLYIYFSTLILHMSKTALVHFR